jgi:hypothetical protein
MTITIEKILKECKVTQESLENKLKLYYILHNDIPHCNECYYQKAQICTYESLYYRPTDYDILHHRCLFRMLPKKRKYIL